jgi:hypothetical protein
MSAVARRLFERFPVATGNDASDHQALLNAVFETLQPQDIIEEVYALDYAYNTWEAQRLRSIQATFFTSESALSDQTFYSPAILAHIHEIREAFGTPVPVLMQRPHNDQERKRLTEEYIRNHPEEYEEELRRRAEIGERIAATLPSPERIPKPTQQTVSAEEARRSTADAFKKNSREIDLISRLIALAETRRDAALHEFECYQTIRRARQGPEEILDAEYTEPRPPRQQRKP